MLNTNYTPPFYAIFMLLFFSISIESVLANANQPLHQISAKECKTCHEEIYDEWSGAMHSMAWTDPYYQADFVFDGSKQICLNCHTPLENQQENLVLGFNDTASLDPILKPNPKL